MSKTLRRVAVTVGLVAVLAPPAAAHPPDPYRIVNHYSGVVVDVPAPGRSTVNVFIVLWPYSGGVNHQGALRD